MCKSEVNWKLRFKNNLHLRYYHFFLRDNVVVKSVGNSYNHLVLPWCRKTLIQAPKLIESTKSEYSESGALVFKRHRRFPDAQDSLENVNVMVERKNRATSRNGYRRAPGRQWLPFCSLCSFLQILLAISISYFCYKCYTFI